MGSSHRSVASDWAAAVIPEARWAGTTGDGRIHPRGTTVTTTSGASSQSMILVRRAKSLLTPEIPRLRPVHCALVVVALLCAVRAAASAQAPCKTLVPAHQAVERGWTAYRANDIPTANTEFRRAVALCPNDPGALTGAGYGAMRQNDLAVARSFFARALAADSGSYDAA